ncbi:hypothetical protein RJ639_032307 [Escallonia herrerae]|uniref:Uncharacterized protein n=1 Tax=Escallonia herrerae TaxID=1293975 RepID=A0AA88WW49_9ASTE|nr:hypothetical protein RJ639_032307 [Escallonia herrerae]
MSKAEIIIIATPAIGNLVPAVEFATHLTTTDPLLSATILIIHMPQRPLVSAYTDSRATATATGNIRFLHLPLVDPPNPDQYQSSVAFISIIVEKHKPQVRNLLTDSDNSVRVAGFFIDMFCTDKNEESHGTIMVNAKREKKGFEPSELACGYRHQTMIEKLSAVSWYAMKWGNFPRKQKYPVMACRVSGQLAQFESQKA